MWLGLLRREPGHEKFRRVSDKDVRTVSSLLFLSPLVIMSEIRIKSGGGVKLIYFV